MSRRNAVATRPSTVHAMCTNIVHKRRQLVDRDVSAHNSAYTSSNVREAREAREASALNHLSTIQCVTAPYSGAVTTVVRRGRGVDPAASDWHRRELSEDRSTCAGCVPPP